MCVCVRARIYIYIYIYIYMYVCMYVCMYVYVFQLCSEHRLREPDPEIRNKTYNQRGQCVFTGVLCFLKEMVSGSGSLS